MKSLWTHKTGADLRTASNGCGRSEDGCSVAIFCGVLAQRDQTPDEFPRQNGELHCVCRLKLFDLDLVDVRAEHLERIREGDGTRQL
jgi:hypothetical protein